MTIIRLAPTATCPTTSFVSVARAWPSAVAVAGSSHLEGMAMRGTGRLARPYAVWAGVAPLRALSHARPRGQGLARSPPSPVPAPLHARLPRGSRARPGSAAATIGPACPPHMRGPLTGRARRSCHRWLRPPRMRVCDGCERGTAGRRGETFHPNTISHGILLGPENASTARQKLLSRDSERRRRCPLLAPPPHRDSSFLISCSSRLST